MATNDLKFEFLETQIKQKKFAPVYFLYGEEPYFLDTLAELIENHSLNEIEKSFNLDVVYGSDVTANQLIAAARSYPVMAERRVIIVKEANQLKKDELEKMASYLDKPVPTTVLAFIYKDKKKPDGRTKFSKLLATKAVVFESKPLKDYEVKKWIEKQLSQQQLSIEPQALDIFVQYLGNNLQLIENEIQKIILYLSDKPNTIINKPILFELINIDKDYNIFELIDHVGRRNIRDAHLVINQMIKNKKENPPIFITNQLFNFFSKLAVLKQKNLLSEDAIAKELGIHPYVARNYKVALQNYTLTRLLQNLLYIQETDLSLKGIHPTRMGEEHTMKTLIFNLLQRQEIR
ncbi:MAG: DNA polymerase III subunit delta [Bacteroidia bacterium]|nr:DNA polymerase III subunit delta [Bacteroidia bacterium]